MYNKIKRGLFGILLAAALYSCKKGEEIETFKEFVNVSFDATRTALANNGQGIFISAKYNGYPIAWDLYAKKIRVGEGEGRFEFYDNRTGEVVAEKIVDARIGEEEAYTMFQPTMQSPVTFIDPHAQDGEAAPPAGHIKLKLASYAGDLIPFDKIDVKVFIQYYDVDWNEFIEEVAVVNNIGKSVDDAVYHIIPDGVPPGITEYTYVFEFRDSETGQYLINHGGTNYSSMAFMPAYMNPFPVKKIFTLYLVSKEAWGEAPVFLKKGDKYYSIEANALYIN